MWKTAKKRLLANYRAATARERSAAGFFPFRASLMKLACGLLAAVALHAQPGILTIHMILHAIGQERYEITPSDGGLTLNTTLQYSDRGMQRNTTAALRTGAGFT